MLLKLLGFNVVIAAIVVTVVAISIALPALAARALLHRYHRVSDTNSPA
jgi:hypothetical protein